MTPKESQAFIAYWSELIKQEYPSATAIKIKWVNPNNHSNYIPESRVAGADRDKFQTSREYFVFEPMTQHEVTGTNQSDFMKKIHCNELSSNVVFDLGGEFGNCSEMAFNTEQEARFNQNFIDNYIVRV